MVAGRRPVWRITRHFPRISNSPLNRIRTLAFDRDQTSVFFAELQDRPGLHPEPGPLAVSEWSPGRAPQLSVFILFMYENIARISCGLKPPDAAEPVVHTPSWRAGSSS